MNKLSISLNVVLLIAVGYLYFLHFKGNKTIVTDPSAISTSFNEMKGTANSIAWINLDTLNEKYGYIAEQYKVLEQEEKNLTTKLNAKMQAASSRYQQLQEKAATMSPQEQEAAGMELQNMEAELKKYQEDQEGAYRKKQQEISDKLENNLDTYLKKINSSSQFDFIISYQQNGPVLLANDSLDITKIVLEGLNKEYETMKTTTDKK
jgi:outer membrane protein